MQRAAILIGVSKTGSLQRLQAVTSGVREMEKWALAQGMDRERVTVITDEQAPVDPKQIKQAIKAHVDAANLDQLVIYFAGHGVNIRYGEFWLLSDAPDDTQAAVNVEGSVVLARQCGIPHVVLMSDACRTAAEGIQAQNVTGSEVFPNLGGAGPEKPVDLFFACALGKPALEIRDPAETARAFRAVYTDELFASLDGKREALFEPLEEGGKAYRIIRPRPLKKHLQTAVVQMLAQGNVPLGTNQTPDARITSDDDVWLARHAAAPVGATRGLRRSVPGPPAITPEAPATLFSVSHSLLRNALTGAPNGIAPPEPPPAATAAGSGSGRLRSAPRRSARMEAGHATEGSSLIGSVRRGVETFGPTQFDTGCGFKVRGARIATVFSMTAAPKLADGDDTQVRVGNLDRVPAANVILTFTNGTGVVVPAIKDFITALSFEGEELVDVAYEPTENSWRWADLGDRAAELRRLRAIVASSAKLGVFRLEREDAAELARRMQFAKGIDPTMALYAAYAYHDLQRRENIVQMQGFLRSDLNLRLFDVSLLARGLDGKQAGADRDVFPFFPLMSQGWALLSAHGVKFPARLQGIERHLVPSLWTVFTNSGIDLVRAAMQAQEVR